MFHLNAIEKYMSIYFEIKTKSYISWEQEKYNKILLRSMNEFKFSIYIFVKWNKKNYIFEFENQKLSCFYYLLLLLFICSPKAIK